MITEAQKYNISVYAWFEFGFASSMDGSPDSGILAKYPQWAAINNTNQKVVEYGLHWMNGYDPEVQDFVSALFLEVARNYDVAGVSADERFPGMPIQAGYDAKTKNMYKKLYGVDPPMGEFDERWWQYRADLLTIFLMDFQKQLNKIKKGTVPFVTAPPYYPYSMQYGCQDWLTWYQLGLAGFYTPQLYNYDI